MGKDKAEAIGLEAAHRRLAYQGFDEAQWFRSEATAAFAVRAGLKLAGSHCPERVQVLLAENIALAAVVRARFGEPDLTPGDLQRITDFFKWSLNSMWHEDWP